MMYKSDIGRFITGIYDASGFETLEVAEKLIVEYVPENLRRMLNGYGFNVSDYG